MSATTSLQSPRRMQCRLEPPGSPADSVIGRTTGTGVVVDDGWVGVVDEGDGSGDVLAVDAGWVDVLDGDVGEGRAGVVDDEVDVDEVVGRVDEVVEGVRDGWLDEVEDGAGRVDVTGPEADPVGASGSSGPAPDGSSGPATGGSGVAGSVGSAVGSSELEGTGADGAAVGAPAGADESLELLDDSLLELVVVASEVEVLGGGGGAADPPSPSFVLIATTTTAVAARPTRPRPVAASAAVLPRPLPAEVPAEAPPVPVPAEAPVAAAPVAIAVQRSASKPTWSAWEARVPRSSSSTSSSSGVIG